MADINSAAEAALLGSATAPAGKRRAGSDPGGPDPKLVTFVELLFFAYRDFTREADDLLAEYGLGRAHHRVLHFVNRSPGLKVAELLDILKITKQSLARVLKELVDQGWIVQHEGVNDRRQRLLHTSEKGKALAQRLDRLQAARVEEALKASGTPNSDAVAQFLLAMTSREEREKVWALLPALPAGLGPSAPGTSRKD
jgi:DNA-binding MarR family transcriptional regulator